MRFRPLDLPSAIECSAVDCRMHLLRDGSRVIEGMITQALLERYMAFLGRANGGEGFIGERYVRLGELSSMHFSAWKWQWVEVNSYRLWRLDKSVLDESFACRIGFSRSHYF
jgi:hypothetical protein